MVMSKDFPFSTDDMLPIAEVMSRTARHWRNVERFFTKKFPKGETVGETDATGGGHLADWFQTAAAATATATWQRLVAQAKAFLCSSQFLWRPRSLRRCPLHAAAS